MAKARSVYRCGECGHDHPKWAGRCEGCGAWNTVAEEPVALAAPPRRKGGRVAAAATTAARLRDITGSRLLRWSTGITELDYVLGSGLVPGSLTLVGGEPGIGKSTLLLQAAAMLQAQGRTVLYASGEESPEQVRLRSDRLDEDAGQVHVLGETRLEAILESSTALGADLLIIDSIQTVYTDALRKRDGSGCGGGGARDEGGWDRGAEDAGAHRRYGPLFRG
jgi:DNA repair protein RadA/Sms